jgi:hypothetical protein
MLTISRLARWSINYYNDTARQATLAGLDRQRANGGLGECYSEGDTREPTWRNAIAQIRRMHPDWSVPNATRLVERSIQHYCPAQAPL